MKAIGMTIARGGSVRLPGKNMKMICGKPLLEWTLLQLTTTKNIAHFWLVTDDEAMAKLGESYGFHISWQPKEEIDAAQAADRMGGPFAFRRGFEDAQKWITTEDKNGDKKPFDVIVPILPTSVLRKPGEIDACIELWLNNQSLPVTAGVQYKDMVMYEKIDGVSTPYVFDHDGRFWENHGGIWVGSPEQYFAYSFKPDGKPLTFQEMAGLVRYTTFRQEFWQRYDIDFQEDFDIAEYFLEKKILKGQGGKVYTDYKEFVLSEYGYEQHAASYNKGVEQTLLPAEYRNSFFNHLPVYLECMKCDDDIIGWELVEKKLDKKGHTERRVMKSIKARNGSDIFAPGNVLKEPKPALIIGSGPSLDAALPLLKNWEGGSFCSTSQGSTLLYYGHEPTHMVAYDINTNPKEFEWADTWANRRTVLVTHPGMFPGTIDYWPGKRMYFKSMDTSNFFFTNVLPVAYGDVIPSHMFLFSCSVAAQMSLAHALGYSPLYFIGCDFLADRFSRWRYDREAKEWKCDPELHGVFNHKGIKSANGLMSDPLQIFYKRSTLCVWRIDGSDCIQCSPSTIISEMPYVPFGQVMVKQGLGFEDKPLSKQQRNDAIEKYLVRFNQFILTFEPDGAGKESFRVLESHQRSDWEADVQRYIEAMAAGMKAQGMKSRVDLEKNMKRFRWLKEQVKMEDANATSSNVER
jgi:CMP-N-acetylneuraminic acid synthetase